MRQRPLLHERSRVRRAGAEGAAPPPLLCGVRPTGRPTESSRLAASPRLTARPPADRRTPRGFPIASGAVRALGGPRAARRGAALPALVGRRHRPPRRRDARAPRRAPPPRSPAAASLPPASARLRLPAVTCRARGLTARSPPSLRRRPSRARSGPTRATWPSPPSTSPSSAAGLATGAAGCSAPGRSRSSLKCGARGGPSRPPRRRWCRPASSPGRRPSRRRSPEPSRSWAGAGSAGGNAPRQRPAARMAACRRAASWRSGARGPRGRAARGEQLPTAKPGRSRLRRHRTRPRPARTAGLRSRLERAGASSADDDDRCKRIYTQRTSLLLIISTNHARSSPYAEHLTGSPLRIGGRARARSHSGAAHSVCCAAPGHARRTRGLCARTAPSFAGNEYTALTAEPSPRAPTTLPATALTPPRPLPLRRSAAPKRGRWSRRKCRRWRRARRRPGPTSCRAVSRGTWTRRRCPAASASTRS